MTTAQKKLIITVLWLSVIAVCGHIIYTYLMKQTINPYGIFALSIFIASLFEFHTFGRTSYLRSHYDNEPRDELEEHIVKTSSKIGYFALMVILLLIYGISEFKNENTANLPLMLALCASIVTLPIIQFIVAQKYK
ncbi:hypothetical protein [Aneurinibacillus uraniidurans]|uniref:hypothetical protein n=1 Tax=Aneurinibacillus uraniidurans TaxID=2966586 RepID=UPI00234B4E17|nr:hypothetical protein [Aneurinibacillus sp. B1]WCN37358.1 hypothetical protein PO771_16345 [Aneurinibacillus sp. B1]